MEIVPKAKRLLTDKELEEYNKLDNQVKQKKFLEKLQEELWIVVQKKVQ